ncbi:hypothetical protein SESBI_47620 [Sesbania bispinosa]|nr:hypothetical protein SESBI_47620 [Sesbania bispinosa]
MKLGWTMIVKPHAFWVQVLHSKYGCGDGHLPRVCKRPNSSNTLRGICTTWDYILKGLRWVVGNGNKAKFWTDSGGYPLPPHSPNSSKLQQQVRLRLSSRAAAGSSLVKQQLRLHSNSNSSASVSNFSSSRAATVMAPVEQQQLRLRLQLRLLARRQSGTAATAASTPLDVLLR